MYASPSYDRAMWSVLKWSVGVLSGLLLAMSATSYEQATGNLKSWADAVARLTGHTEAPAFFGAPQADMAGTIIGGAVLAMWIIFMWRNRSVTHEASAPIPNLALDAPITSPSLADEIENLSRRINHFNAQRNAAAPPMVVIDDSDENWKKGAAYRNQTSILFTQHFGTDVAKAFAALRNAGHRPATWLEYSAEHRIDQIARVLAAYAETLRGGHIIIDDK